MSKLTLIWAMAEARLVPVPPVINLGRKFATCCLHYLSLYCHTPVFCPFFTSASPHFVLSFACCGSSLNFLWPHFFSCFFSSFCLFPHYQPLCLLCQQLKQITFDFSFLRHSEYVFLRFQQMELSKYSSVFGGSLKIAGCEKTTFSTERTQSLRFHGCWSPISTSGSSCKQKDRFQGNFCLFEV